MSPKTVRDEEGRRYILVPVRESSEYVGREYIMEKLGISHSALSHQPWMYPDFGKAIAGRRNCRPYRKEEVDEWLAIPAKKRRRMYLEACE